MKEIKKFKIKMKIQLKSEREKKTVRKLGKYFTTSLFSAYFLALTLL